ncbi:MAG TPA: SDR family oxidoreductase [Spirochaetota bacterium]|nr:SDR family oxidoreductase [Spirochaetota bacterium]HPI88970.1 SDR family oxidoreductase [Spirochaetota bacterium]HPR47457.1 SDR family oxidoreductase [Spirochaetota bacterium]
MNHKPYAFITGATSGIGAEFARQLAARGMNLVLTGRRKDVIKNIAAEVKQKTGSDVEVIIAELSDPADLNRVISKIKKTQRLEYLVNNAGFGTNGFFHEESIVTQEIMLRVHADTTMKLTHAAIPGMIRNGHGAIINVASLSARVIMPSTVMYSATKAFLLAFSETLHLELARHNIKVQALCPGFTRSDFHHKMGLEQSILNNRGLTQWMAPDAVVRASLNALNKKNRVICVPGKGNAFLFNLVNFLPRSLFYKIAGASDSLQEYFAGKEYAQEAVH